MSTANVKGVVREKYGQAALRVTSGAGNPYCRDDPSTLEGSGLSPIHHLRTPALNRFKND
jgi:hypothetical protein